MDTKTSRTSEILEEILQSSDNHQVTVREFVDRLSDRTFGLVIVVFSMIDAIVPFASTVFSIPIILVAIQMILGQHKIWIPKRVAEKKFSQRTIKKALKRSIPTLKFMEKFIKPRALWVTSNIGERVIAFVILILALVVALPAPGFNLLPALCMCFLAIGIMERDGMMLIIGSIFSIATVYGISFAIYKVATELLKIAGII
jgi:hypothetical protein